jgi:hypothetical protein
MIKLLLINTLEDGTKRYQSQLYLGKNTADFIMKTDGIMRYFNNGDRGFDFYEFKEPYQIVSDISEMRTQQI